MLRDKTPEGKVDTDCGDGEAAERRTDRPADVEAGVVDGDRAVEVVLGHQHRRDEQPCGRSERAGHPQGESRREKGDGRRQTQGNDSRKRDGDRAARDLRAKQQAACVDDVRQGPAGKVSRNIGNEVAIWTADTIIGLGLRLVINQLVEVSNMAMPTFDAELAIRMTVKAGLLNTPQRESRSWTGPTL